MPARALGYGRGKYKVCQALAPALWSRYYLRGRGLQSTFLQGDVRLRGKLLGVLLVVTVLAVEMGITSALFRPSWSLFGQQGPAQANVAGPRLGRITEMLEPDSPPGEVETAMQEGLALLFDTMRPLPSPGVDAAQEQRIETVQALIRDGEREFASALEGYALKGKDEALRARARGLKVFVEQAAGLSRSLGELTRRYGPASLDAPPCDGLRPLLDASGGAGSPFLPLSASGPGMPWPGPAGDDVLVTRPLAAGECVAVFRQDRGFTFSLRFEQASPMSGPWMEALDIPSDGRPALWTLQGHPDSHLEQWDICNTGGKIERTVTQPSDGLLAGPRW